jgi:hypothetical protein
MVSQTLLFTAYAALYYAAATADAAILQAQRTGKEETLQLAAKLPIQMGHIISLVPGIGASVSFLIWIAVIAAIRAIFILKGQHDKAIVIPPENQHEHYGYHRLGISDQTTILGLVPPCLIPLIFFCVWRNCSPQDSGVRLALSRESFLTRGAGADSSSG